MGNPQLLLLDPSGTLRQSAPSLETLGFRECSTTEDLTAALATRESIRVFVIDLTSLVPSDVALLADHSGAGVDLWLAAVASESEGCEWLERYFTDFVVLPGEAARVDAKVKRLAALREDIVSPRFQAASQSGFLGEVVHTMKNPLNSIFGYTELLLMDESLSEESRADLDKIFTCAQALLESCERIAGEAERLLEQSEGEVVIS